LEATTVSFNGFPPYGVALTFPKASAIDDI